MKTVLRLTVVFWICNEVIQHVGIKINGLFDFFIIHMSSFYGAFIVTYYLVDRKYSVYLLLIPLLLQMGYNLHFKNNIDFFDLLFFLIGGLVAFIFYKKYYDQ